MVRRVGQGDTGQGHILLQINEAVVSTIVYRVKVQFMVTARGSPYGRNSMSQGRAVCFVTLLRCNEYVRAV